MTVTKITTDDLALHAQWVADPATGRRLVASYANLRSAVFESVNLTGADFTGADFTGADLTGGDFRDCNLRGAYFWGCNLRDANFINADLRGAVFMGADLMGADLRGCNLRDANLIDANILDADLMDADLRGAFGLPIAKDAPQRLLAAARAALQPGALNMSTWHTCETNHCLSGMAVHQAGEVGRVLEAAVGNHMAGLYLLGPEAALHFYDSNEAATEYLRGVVAAAEAREEK